LLTKRTHIVPVLIALLVFPAAALAAGGGGGEARSPFGHPGNASVGLSNAEVAPAGLLPAGVDRFDQVVHAFARRIHAAARERRRQLYAHLPGGVSLGTLEAIAACESGGDPTAVSADGAYRGKFQFDYGTWESVGGHGDPAAAPEAEQDYRAALLYSQSGSSPWPVCG
jgi:hypothetical protein